MRKILEQYENEMVMIKGKYVKKREDKYYLFNKIVVYKNAKIKGIEHHVNELEVDFKSKPKLESKRNYFLTGKVTRYKRKNGTEDFKITEAIVDFI